MSNNWNQDTVMDILGRHPELVSFDTDNYGQIIIYTGLRENNEGELESMNPDCPIVMAAGFAQEMP